MTKRHWLYALIPLAAGVAAGILRRIRRTQAAAIDKDDERPADVGFMRAIHDASRRDVARLLDLAPQLEGRRPPKGWATLRDTLHYHHAAEDTDLWPVLRERLTDLADVAAVDHMVEEHRELEAAVDATDDALERGQGVAAAAQHLDRVLRQHLDHEETAVFPLLETHLTRRDWRHFLETERDKRPARERPEFVAWVLDDASDDDAAAVLAELPKPAHLVYRLVLRPRYAAQHRWRAA